MKLLIKNGRVVHPVTGTVVLQDILAENGRIVLMERGLDGEADRVVDAAGLMVAPGLVAEDPWEIFPAGRALRPH